MSELSKSQEDMKFSLKKKQKTGKQTHIGGDPCTVFDRVALYGDVVNLAVSVGENKMLPGWDGLARLWLALSILQEAEMKKIHLGQPCQGQDVQMIIVKNRQVEKCKHVIFIFICN